MSTKSSLPTESAQVNAEFEFLSEVSERDAKWDYHKNQAQAVAAIYAQMPQKFGKLADRMNACALWLFLEWTRPDLWGVIKLKLKKAMFCKVRHCPICSWRRSLANVARFFSKLPALRELYPTHRWIFLTLTVPNVPLPELRAKIVAMNSAWKRLIERKSWPAKGWIRTVEVTHEWDPAKAQKGLPVGRKGYAHPHFHCMLMVPASYFGKGYVKQETWLQLWQEAMRDSTITQVDIRVVKPKIDGQDLHAAACELLKYGTKVDDGLNDKAWLFGITEQLHRCRFLATGGALKDLLKEELSDEEMIHSEDGEVSEVDKSKGVLAYKFIREVRKYCLQKS